MCVLFEHKVREERSGVISSLMVNIDQSIDQFLLDDELDVQSLSAFSHWCMFSC